jgi:hypothetical protein
VAGEAVLPLTRLLTDHALEQVVVEDDALRRASSTVSITEPAFAVAGAGRDSSDPTFSSRARAPRACSPPGRPACRSSGRHRRRARGPRGLLGAPREDVDAGGGDAAGEVAGLADRAERAGRVLAPVHLPLFDYVRSYGSYRVGERRSQLATWRRRAMRAEPRRVGRFETKRFSQHAHRWTLWIRGSYSTPSAGRELGDVRDVCDLPLRAVVDADDGRDAAEAGNQTRAAHLFSVGSCVLVRLRLRSSLPLRLEQPEPLRVAAPDPHPGDAEQVRGARVASVTSSSRSAVS